MGIDTKPNLSSNKFEQCASDVMNLSGCTQIYGTFDMESGSTLSICDNAGANKVLTSNASGVATWQSPSAAASGDKISKTITQASHGFAVKDVVGFSGTTYNKPIADGTYDGEILGLVTAVPDGNNFELTQAGYISGLTSLVQNTTYFLSDVTAGLLTSTEPTGDTTISKTMFFADSTTSGWVLPYAGYYNTTGTSSGGGTWGSITGTLSDQEDLQAALDAKVNLSVYSAFTGTSIYSLNSPATCTVGGVTPGYVLTGKSIQCIIQDAFAPYIAPTFSAFAVNITSPIEVGTAVSGTKSFTWTTTTSGNVASNSIGILNVTSGTTLGSGLANDSAENLSIGTLTNAAPQTWTFRVTGCSTQSASFQRDVSKCSIYPYFWGVVTSGSCPTITSGLVDAGNKVVLPVGTTVSVDFASSSQWTWFAMPASCAARTKWFVAVGNCGFVDRGCASDKYPNSCTLDVTDGGGCWSSVSYKVYMSGFAATDGEAIAFRTY